MESRQKKRMVAARCPWKNHLWMQHSHPCRSHWAHWVNWDMESRSREPRWFCSKQMPEMWGIHISSLATFIFIIICRTTDDILHSLESLSAVCKHLSTPYEANSLMLILQMWNAAELILLWKPLLPDFPACVTIFYPYYLNKAAWGSSFPT